MPAVAPDLVLNWNPSRKRGRTCASPTALASSGFRCSASRGSGSTGRTFLTQFPNFAKDILGGDEHVVTFLLALFSVGIGVGSLLCERLSGHKVEIGLVPFGSIGLSVFAFDLWLATRDMHATGLVGIAGIRGPARAPARRGGPRADRPLRRLLHRAAVCADPGAIRARVPLAHHRRQQHPERDLHGRVGRARDRTARRGLSIPYLFLTTAILNAAVALFIYRLVPEFLMRFLAWILIHTMYRVKKEGLDNVPGDGPLHHRVQPRELRRRHGHRRVRAQAHPLRDGPPHLPRAGAELALPHDAGDPRRRRRAKTRSSRTRRSTRQPPHCAQAKSSASSPKGR
jgi:hypothetical protein